MTVTEEFLFFTEERLGRGPETPFWERFPCTDAGNAELFAALHRDRLRYDHKRGRWLEWAGHWWRRDTTEQVVQLAVRTARYRFHQAESILDLQLRQKVSSWAIRSESRARLDACLTLARSMWPLADDADWDTDAWLLGVENGVVDLRTGELRPGRPEDRITKHAPVPYEPDSTCPRFLAFLERVQPDLQHREYLQRRAGYALTGDVSEQDLLFHYGSGANGKTTFANALRDSLGRDYAKQAAPRLLVRARGERHPTELADLEGARLVVSCEVDEGTALAEELTKQLTGDDPVKGRFMRQDFFEFDMTAKLWLLANHKPAVRGSDWGIWRRIKLMPWNVVVPDAERDPHLRDKLRAEAPGILVWAVRGCLAWQQDGMRTPDSVVAATEAYRVESDLLGEFLEEHCVLGPTYFVTAGALFRQYQEWANSQGIGERDPARMTSTAFGKKMGQRFERGRAHNGARGYRGIGLVSERQEGFDADGFSASDGTSAEEPQSATQAATNPANASPDHAQDATEGDALGTRVTGFESGPSGMRIDGNVTPTREPNQQNAPNASARQPGANAVDPATRGVWEEEL
jgi:putative DNA primase/helicase